MPNLREKTWTSTTPANVEDAQFWEDHLISNEDASKLENITGVPDGGSSGQVLTRTTNGIGWRDPASSGHTVQNAAGVDMPYQGTLQFLGADVANDSENDKTVVDCHGEKGDAATIAAGTVTMLPAGSTPTVTNSGTSSAAIFDFGIPSSDGGVQSLIKDTVGWTGKNRAYSQTNNAVIAHIENGITYDVSWTGSATVTLKKDSASGATITSGSTSPLSFTADADYELYFGSSATVTNILVKDSRITDPTYEPYHESVEEEVKQIYTDNGVLGAKNLLKITQNTRTINGVTFTVNRDSDGNVINVTANGTATADATFTLLADYADFEKGDYKITGCPTGGTATTYEIFTAVRHLDATATEFVRDFGNGASLTVDNNTRNIALSIIVRNNTVASNIVFKPMITLASDPLSDYEHYVPYAMTNRELTDVKNVTVTAGANVTVHANTNISKVGKIVSGSLRLVFTSALTVQQVLATLSDKPMINTYAIGIESTTNKAMPIIILNNGQVMLFGSNLPTDTNNHLIIPVNFITA